MIPREGLPDLNFGLGDYGGATYSCTEQQLAEVLSLVGAKQDLARAICTQYDCSVSTSICVLQYLTNAQLKLGDAMNNTASRETELGLDVMFVLFSAFLVFNMQLVSGVSGEGAAVLVPWLMSRA